MKENKNFNSWLAGLIEGDGAIVVPKVREAKGKKTYPHIQVALNKKDKVLAEKIVESVGGSCDIDKNTVRLTWRKKADLIKIIEIINGKMRTPKIQRLHLLIDWYNEDGANIEKKNVDMTPIGENAWLSGMSDADSGFVIIITNRGKIQRQWRLEISQKTHNGSDQQNWAALVSAYIGSNLLSRHRITKDGKGPEKLYSSYKIIAHNEESLKKMEEYFTKYPLLSSKYLDYKDWKSSGEIKEKTPENYKKAQEYKNGMNSKRTYLNWDHLKNKEQNCRLSSWGGRE